MADEIYNGEKDDSLLTASVIPDDEYFLETVKRYNDEILPVIKKLKNGMSIAHIHTPCNETFKIELVIRAGVLQEKADQIGFAHLIEHLMSFYPSSKYPNSIENQQEINKRGLQMNAWTSEHTCGYYVEGLSNYQDMIIDLLFQNYIDPVLDKEVFNQEKAAVVKELESITSDAWYNLDKMIDLVEYHGTNLEYTVEYEIRNVDRNATLNNILEFRDTYYKPELTTVMITSNKTDHEFDELVDIIERLYFPETLEKSYKVIKPNYDIKVPNPRNIMGYTNFGNESYFRVVYIPQKKKEETLIEETPIEEQSEVVPETNFENYKFFYIHPNGELNVYKLEIHFPIDYFGPFDDEVHTLKFLEMILADGLGSRLYYALRTVLGSVYHVYSGSHLDPLNNKYNKFVIETETSEEKLKDVIDYILVELQQIIDNNCDIYDKCSMEEIGECITDREFQQYKDTMSNEKSHEYCSSSFYKHFNFYNQHILWGKKLITIEEVIEKRNKVNKKNVCLMAKKIFDPSKMKIFYSGNKPILEENNKHHIIVSEKDFKNEK